MQPSATLNDFNRKPQRMMFLRPSQNLMYTAKLCCCSWKTWPCRTWSYGTCAIWIGGLESSFGTTLLSDFTGELESDRSIIGFFTVSGYTFIEASWSSWMRTFNRRFRYINDLRRSHTHDMHSFWNGLIQRNNSEGSTTTSVHFLHNVLHTVPMSKFHRRPYFSHLA